MRDLLIECQRRGINRPPTGQMFLQAQDRRLAVRRGKQRATVAVGHTILRIAYHLLQDPARVYEERGAHADAERHRQTIERDLVRRLQRLGNTVVLQPVGVT
jgi:transposase